MNSAKPSVLIFVVAYNAERTIANVLARIPRALSETYEVEILIIDDSSADGTFAASHLAIREGDFPFRTTVLYNPVNQGYGGNQKIGYHYAIENGYDFVALLHGDGQYAPECLPELLEPLRKGEAAAVFGSRMIDPSGALRGGMPLYKFAGNRILTWVENRLLNSNLSEFHSGYRLYAVSALSAIPFDRNSNGFHFDTEIIIQLLIARLAIVELPIPTYYGDEICYVNGLKYAVNVLTAVFKARLQHSGLFYDRKFDCAPPSESPYRPKLTYDSPHTLAFGRVREHSRVLDIGCAGGYLAPALSADKGCTVDGIDSRVAAEPALNEFYLWNLNDGLPRLDFGRYDFVLMLDVIEHLASPEGFLDTLRGALATNPSVEIIISTANIGFLVTRLMLLLGQFNYGPRGILDLTHTRLFTFASFERAVTQSGFDVLERVGVPGPFPLALGDTFPARLLLRLNGFLIHLSRGLFSYQILFRIKPRPSLALLLKNAQEVSSRRASELKSAGRVD